VPISGRYFTNLVIFSLSAFLESCSEPYEKGMISLHHTCTSDALQCLEYVVALLDVTANCLSTQHIQDISPVQLMKPSLSVPDKDKRLPLHHLEASSKKYVMNPYNFLLLLILKVPSQLTFMECCLPFQYASLSLSSTLGVWMLFINLNAEVISLCHFPLRQNFKWKSTA
jgi:hypothetical protein